MKLLFDQNISRKLVNELKDVFPESSHVYLIGFHKASDEDIWNYARDNNFTIVTQDCDFNERSIVYGYPPKVIWLRMGNVSTQSVKRLLKKHSKGILLLGENVNLGCLQIY